MRVQVHRVAIASLLAIAFALTGFRSPSSGAAAQNAGCIPDMDQNRIELGSPNAEGNTRHVDMTDPSVIVGLHFSVAQPNSALLYIGDQWYDLDLFLYARGACQATGGWETLIRAWSVRAESRVIQLMRPNEQIVNVLPGEYLMVAQYHPSGAAVFDPSKGFTARVATNSPYCGLDPRDELQPNPAVPSITIPRRPDEALYQLGLSIDPPERERVPFSLMSFGAFLSPPYTDLFDFAWRLDGQPVALDPATVVYQIPTEALTRTTGGPHTIKVTATGARYYPDPSLTHLPPTLSVECAFATASTQSPAASDASSPAKPGGSPTSPPGNSATPAPANTPVTGPTSSPSARPSTPASVGPASSGRDYPLDYGMLQRCKDRVGVASQYASSQQFDQVVACMVQETLKAGSSLSPGEIERGIRSALAA